MPGCEGIFYGRAVFLTTLMVRVFSPFLWCGSNVPKLPKNPYRLIYLYSYIPIYLYFYICSLKGYSRNQGTK